MIKSVNDTNVWVSGIVWNRKDLLRIGSYESVQIVRKQTFLLLLESATDDSSEKTEFFSKTAGFYRSESASKTRFLDLFALDSTDD